MFKSVSKMLLIMAVVSLSGCSLIGYKEVKQYEEPKENEPRARVMLVGDYGGWYHFSIMDFYVQDPVLGELYLHAEGEKTNRPKVKNLGIDVEVKGKNKANQVYLPTNQSLNIRAYGQYPGMNQYTYCRTSKDVTFNDGIDYVLSFDQIKASGKEFCVLNLYEVTVTDNGKKLEIVE